MDLTHFLFNNDSPIDVISFKGFPVRQVDFRSSYLETLTPNIVWHNWELEELLTPIIINPNFKFFSNSTSALICNYKDETGNLHLKISSGGKIINDFYWNSTNIFKEFFIGIWGNQFTKTDNNGTLVTNPSFPYSISFHNDRYEILSDMEATLDLIKFSSLSIDLSEVNGILNTNNTYIIEPFDDPYVFLYPYTGTSLPFGDTLVPTLALESAEGSYNYILGPFLNFYGKYLNFETVPNYSSEPRTGKITFTLYLGYDTSNDSLLVPYRFKYKPATKLLNIHRSFPHYYGWESLDGTQKKLFTFEELPIPEKDFFYKNIFATGGTVSAFTIDVFDEITAYAGETGLPLHWEVQGQELSFGENITEQLLSLDVQLNEFDFIIDEGKYKIDGIEYERFEDSDSPSIDLLIPYYPPLTFSITLEQRGITPVAQFESLTTTGNNFYWDIPQENTMLHGDDLLLINNITYDSFSQNDSIDIFFNDNVSTVMAVTFTKAKSTPADNILWDIYSREPATESSVISNGTGVRIKNLVEDFQYTIYYLISFNGGPIPEGYRQVVLGLIKSEYTEAPIINQIGTENLTYDSATGTYSIDLVMEIQKNTVTQKAWFTYNNSDLNPEDRHFATLREYDTYYKGTLHIDYLTTGTQYFYQGYAGNAYGEDVEIVHNFFTPPTPTIQAVSNISYTTATFNGSVLGTVSSYGFKYNKKSTPANIITVNSINLSNGGFSYNATGLSEDTEYEIISFACNSGGCNNSPNKLTFKTLRRPAIVITNNATNVTYNSAIISASFTKGTYNVIAAGFEWGITDSMQSEDIPCTIVGNTFSTTLTNLEDDKTYYYRGYVMDNHPTSNKDVGGVIKTFITEPNVITYTITVSPNTASYNYIEESKQFTITPKKFINGNESAESIKWSYSVTSDADGLIKTISSNPSSQLGTSTVTITSNSNINANNTSSEERFAGITFSIVGSSGTTANLSLEQVGIQKPGITLSTPTANNCYSITVSGTIYIGDGVLDTSDYGIRISLYNTMSSFTYQKCINYNSSNGSYSYTFDNLSPSTKYYFQGYAKNTAGLYGESTVVSKVTSPAPSVTTLAATSIEHHTATLNGSYNLTSSGVGVNSIGFEWTINEASGFTHDETIVGTSTPFHLDVSGLASGDNGTTYYFRAYIVDSIKKIRYYGTVLNFTTDADVITYTVTVSPNEWEFPYSGGSSNAKTFIVTPKKFVNDIESANVVNWDSVAIDGSDLIYSISPSSGTGQKNVTIRANSNISGSNQNTNTKNAVVKFRANSSDTYYATLQLSQKGIFIPSTTISSVVVNNCYQITVSCTVSMHGINFGVNGYGIQYSTSSSFLSPTYQKCTNLNGTTYSYVFTSLSPNTTYYFRAYAQNIESLYGVSTISSRTTPAAPTVTTSSATLIGHHTARLNGSYSMGSSGMTINTIGFEWGKSKYDLNLGGNVLSTTSPFYLDISDLQSGESGTTYYFRAYITDKANHTYYSHINENTFPYFTTDADVITYDISLDDTYEEFGYSGGTKYLDLSVAKYINGVFNTSNLGWTTTISDADDAIVSVTPYQGTGNTNNIAVVIGENVSSNNTNTGTRYASVTFKLNLSSTTTDIFQIDQTGVQVPYAYIYSVTVNSTSQITVRGYADFKGEYAYYYAIYSSTSSGGSYLPTEGSNWNSSTKLFSVVFSGLDAETTYYFKAFAENLAGLTSISSYSSGTTYGIPAVVEMKSSSATSSSLSLSAEFISRGSSTITACGFIVGTVSTLVGGTTYSVTVPAGVEIYNKTISSGISDGTKYYFQAYATNGAGTSYSSIDNITTPVAITVPYFSSILLTASGQTSIDIEAYINNGGATITAGRIYYKKASDSTYSYVSVSMSSGSFEYTLSSLTIGTNYYIYLSAQNSVGWGDSSVRQEETDPATSPSVALLLDAYGDPVNSADENTITLYGNLISNGGSSITSWGFRYSLSINGSNQLVTPITTASITSGTAFEKLIEGLSYDTTYYYQAYATNSMGTGYSLVSNVTTEEQVVPTYTIELTVEGTGEGDYLYYHATITSGGPAQSSIHIGISQFKTYTNIQGTLGESTKSSSKSLTIGVGSYTTSISTGILQDSLMRSGKVTTYSTITNVTFTTPLSEFVI